MCEREREGEGSKGAKMIVMEELKYFIFWIFNQGNAQLGTVQFMQKDYCKITYQCIRLC